MILQIFLVNSLQYYYQLGKYMYNTQFQPGHIAVFFELLDLVALDTSVVVILWDFGSGEVCVHVYA